MNMLGYSVFDKLGPSDEKKQLKNEFKKKSFSVGVSSGAGTESRG